MNMNSCRQKFGISLVAASFLAIVWSHWLLLPASYSALVGIWFCYSAGSLADRKLR
jgi:hypothetical protein